MKELEFRDTVKKLAEWQSEKNFAEAMFKLSQIPKKDRQGVTLVPVRLRLVVEFAREPHAAPYFTETVEVNMTTVNNEPQHTGNDAATLALLRIVNAVRLLALIENQLSLERLEAFQLPAPVADALATSSCSDVLA